jgi:hypothetical protein
MLTGKFADSGLLYPLLSNSLDVTERIMCSRELIFYMLNINNDDDYTERVISRSNVSLTTTARH